MKNVNVRSKIKRSKSTGGIPDNLTHEFIIKAIKLIDKEGIPRNRRIRKYYVEYNNRQYPCKLLISKANIFATGEELHWDPRIFQSQLAIKYLNNLGFDVRAF